jgi:peptidyl-prolyl cis-trans isomerase B (cyclophilin B)
VPGNKDRQRRAARAKYERQREQRAARQARLRKLFLTVFSALMAAGLILGLTFGVFLSGTKGTPEASSSKSASASATPTASTVAEPAHHCTYSTATTVAKKVKFPPATPDYTSTYTATIKTNLGDIKLNLLNSKATCTVNSFVNLAEQGYFNNTQCHRMLTSGIYVLQCGDAYATASSKLACSTTSNIGSGMPGYEYASENLTGATYGPGVVAMANEGTATTNGSQFFFIYKDSTAGLTNSGQLAPAYTPFATVSSGLNIVQNVAKDGFSCQYPSSAGGGVPKEKVIIDSVTIQKT